MKTKSFVIEVEPFQTEVTIVVADTVAKGIKWANKNLVPKLKIPYKGEETTNGMFCYRTYKGCDYNVIFLKANSTYNTIVHEAFHAVTRISYDRGSTLSESSEEFFAYSLGNFTGKLIEEYDRCKE